MNSAVQVDITHERMIIAAFQMENLHRMYAQANESEWLTSLLYDSVGTHSVPLAVIPEENEVILGVQLNIFHEGMVFVHANRSPGLQQRVGVGLVMMLELAVP